MNRLTEEADAAADIATSYTMEVGQSALGEISEIGDEDWYAIHLVGGRTYDFRLLGFGFAFAEDPFLGLYDASGGFIGENDDGFSISSNTHGFDSRLIYTAPFTDVYYLRAEDIGIEGGDYLLSATERNPAGMNFTVDEIAWQLINNGAAYASQPEAAAFNIGVDLSLTVDISGLSSDGKFLARQALQAWTSVSGIGFELVKGGAEIVFDDISSGAFTDRQAVGRTITGAAINIGPEMLDTYGTTLDSYSFETFLHEIGHALGLAHGGNYGGSAIYGTNNFYLNDSVAWSIMSYMQAENDEFDFGNDNDWNTFVDASFRHVFTPQVADIIAIQDLYGKFTSAFLGSTTYGFGGNSGVEAIDGAVKSKALMAMTIYDSGGRDRLDFSRTGKDQTISLEQVSLSSVLGGRSNLGIARGTWIEDAVSGSGSDALIGNARANRLEGGRGADTLSGGGGRDSLFGNGGGDTFAFSTGDTAAGRSMADTIFDFTRQDMIDLGAWDGVVRFIGEKRFSGVAGDVRYVKEASETWIMGDTDGDRKTDFTIHLDYAVALKTEHFSL